MNRVIHQARSRIIGHATRLSMIVSGILLCGVFLCGLRSEASAAQGAKAPASKWVAQMPEGTGKNLIVAKCQFCHTLQTVATARRTKDQWAEAIDSMTQMGAPVTDSEASIIVDYLTTNFGPAGSKPPAPASTSTAGAIPGSVAVTSDALVDPDQAQFSPIPDSLGSSKGVEMIVISGDPLKGGPFSVLLKISAGGIVPPNWLSGAKTIVCLRGSFQFGEGDSPDAGKLQTLNPGFVIRVASQMSHFLGQSKEGSTILVYGDGPMSISRQ